MRLTLSWRKPLNCFLYGNGLRHERFKGLITSFISEAAIQRCSYKKVFRKYAANLQKNIHVELWVSNFIEIALQHGCFPVNLLHIFKTLFLKNTSEWLLLIFLLLHCFNVRHKSKLAQKSCEIPGNSCSKVFKMYYIIKRFVNYFEYAILSLPNLLVHSLNTTSV